jgi:drug/metabolite transporter (DMT)-like permease
MSAAGVEAEAGLAADTAPEAAEPLAEVHSHRTALALLVALSLIWGVHWVIVKVGLGYVPPLTYAASRVGIALVVMAALLGARGRLRLPDRANLSIILSIGLAQVAAGVVLQNYALQVVAAGRSAVLVYTMPLWVAVILALAFRIRPRPAELAGLVLGIAGLVLLLNPATIDWSTPGELAGALGLLLNAVLWAAVTIHVRRHRWTQSPLDLQPWQLLTALIPLAVLAVVVERGQGIRWEPATLFFLLYSGVLATAFAVWATQAITRSLGSQASATGYLAIPVVGLLSGWLFLGESLGPADVLGFGLVLAGVAVTSFLPGAGTVRR